AVETELRHANELPAHGDHRRVAGELARAEASAIHDNVGRLEDLVESRHCSHDGSATERSEPPRQPIEIQGHLDDGDPVGDEPIREAGGKLVCARATEAREDVTPP